MDDHKRTQQLSISLFKIFIQFCEANNLRYYVIGGTLIGVLRHKGFIPWDDDIDVGMPRSDYDKFVKLIKEKMPIGYGLCDRHTNQTWKFAFCQFVDKETEIEIHLAECARKAHIWLDVFPIDGLPTNKLSKWLRVKHVLIYRYLIQLANIATQVDSHRVRPFYEKIVLKTAKIIRIGKILNSDKILDRLENLLKKCDFDRSVYAGNMLGRYREREVVLQSYFGEHLRANFEGVDVCIPAKYNELQTALYGDYMKLPPEKNRVAHNVTILKSRN